MCMLYSNMIFMECCVLCKLIIIIVFLGEIRGREDRMKWDIEWNRGYGNKE